MMTKGVYQVGKSKKLTLMWLYLITVKSIQLWDTIWPGFIGLLLWPRLVFALLIRRSKFWHMSLLRWSLDWLKMRRWECPKTGDQTSLNPEISGNWPLMEHHFALLWLRSSEEMSKQDNNVDLCYLNIILLYGHAFINLSFCYQYNWTWRLSHGQRKEQW